MADHKSRRRIPLKQYQGLVDTSLMVVKIYDSIWPSYPILRYQNSTGYLELKGENSYSLCVMTDIGYW